MSNIGKVVEMTNIDAEDFTHAYGGQPFTVRAGETMAFPWDVGVHLARHLARKMLIRGDRGAIAFDEKDKTSNTGKGTVIFNQANEEAVMAHILGASFEREADRELTDGEKLKRQIDEINEWRRKVEASAAPVEATESEPVTEKAPDVEIPEDIQALNRRELMAKAKELGRPFAVTATNDDLRRLIS